MGGGLGHLAVVEMVYGDGCRNSCGADGGVACLGSCMANRLH